MIVEIVVVVAVVLGVVLARTPMGRAIKAGLCDGVKQGIEEAKRHPQEGKTLQDMEDPGYEMHGDTFTIKSSASSDEER